MFKTLFVAMLTVLFFGCAGVQKPAPAPAAPPPPPADVVDGPHQYEGPPPVQSASLKLTAKVPKGWKALGADEAELPPGFLMVMLNPATRAMIMIAVYPSKDKTPQAACEELAEQIKAQQGVTAKIKVAADGSSASFTFSRKADGKLTKGKITARVLPGKKELTATAIGMWPGKSDKAMVTDFDLAANSLDAE